MRLASIIKRYFSEECKPLMCELNEIMDNALYHIGLLDNGIMKRISRDN